LQNGFRVWCSDNTYWQTYLFFSIDGKLGYVQHHEFRGFSFSSVHKPCPSNGTGFALDGTAPTIERATICCNTHNPGCGRGEIVKWNLDKWIKFHPHLMELTKESVDEMIAVD
jgi:hypothetical protein